MVYLPTIYVCFLGGKRMITALRFALGKQVHPLRICGTFSQLQGRQANGPSSKRSGVPLGVSWAVGDRDLIIIVLYLTSSPGIMLPTPNHKSSIGRTCSSGSSQVQYVKPVLRTSWRLMKFSGEDAELVQMHSANESDRSTIGEHLRRAFFVFQSQAVGYMIRQSCGGMSICIG
ncbi:uncharacterized protein BO72DRAFT_309464 [Aspergillus fijiensis CBS 313.89]|uniref:Uncharacterized protein n=1 Tax=Aspergillus fijiensis CBS 313.89 TaxID=1448319 RepID=A0A8G1RG53_9EURO|nr:uncharacterized protein BO72DRAFT_309464 [Aspergillus fijiensis CBS 313.89]RAK71742.1 hypothetical protein BO72DRAFT_309464 [Aspergillus fijiensis CBS 313.89]